MTWSRTALGSRTSSYRPRPLQAKIAIPAGRQRSSARASLIRWISARTESRARWAGRPVLGQRADLVEHARHPDLQVLAQARIRLDAGINGGHGQVLPVEPDNPVNRLRCEHRPLPRLGLRTPRL